MWPNKNAPWPYTAFNERCQAEMYPLKSGEIFYRPYRMESGFYASEGYRGVQAMERSGFEI